MTPRIEKIVFISYRRKSSHSTMQPNFSSLQKRIRPHTLSPRERGKPTRRSIVTSGVRSVIIPSKETTHDGAHRRVRFHQLTWGYNNNESQNEFSYATTERQSATWKFR